MQQNLGSDTEDDMVASGISSGAPHKLPPAAPRLSLVRSVHIRGRVAAAPNQRQVSFYCTENGKRSRRIVSVGRPTAFEEVVVAVVDEVSDLPWESMVWPASFRQGAGLAFRKMREAHSRLSAPMRADVPMFDVRGFEPNNMAHLLLDILPLCFFARDALQGRLKCIFRDVRGPFRELLNVLEVPAVFTTRRLAGQIVHVRGTRGLAVYDLLGVFDCPSITVLPHVYDGLSFKGSRRAEKLFLARRGGRALINQAEVERMLVARGYETVHMEDYGVHDQLALAAQAKHVVAVHGAAMATLIMNRELHSVIELLPPHVWHSYFAICLERRVGRYILMMPEFCEEVPHSGWSALKAYKDAPFTVDLPALEQALEEAL